MLIIEEHDPKLQKSRDNKMNKEYEDENGFQPNNQKNTRDEVKKRETISLPPLLDDYKDADKNIFKHESTIRHRNKGTSESSTVASQNEEKKVKPFPRGGWNSRILSKGLHWSWMLVALLVFAAVIYLPSRISMVDVGFGKSKVRIEMTPPFIEDFANSTTELVENIIKVDLPSSGSVMDGTVSCRRFASIVEDSPAFKETGPTIAKHLLKFSDEIMVAGIALEDMYRNGDMLFWVLNNEISEMISKMRPSLLDRLFENEDKTFFKYRIRELINMIDEFRGKVTNARRAVVDAEHFRGSAEKSVRQGITEAKKFINHGPNVHEYRLVLNDVENYLERIGDDEAIDVLNSINELKRAEDMLKLLEQSHVALDFIDKILLSYRNKLYDVEAQLGKAESRVTKKDLERLKRLVGILETSQKTFVNKDVLSDNRDAKIYV